MSDAALGGVRAVSYFSGPQSILAHKTNSKTKFFISPSMQRAIQVQRGSKRGDGCVGFARADRGIAYGGYSRRRWPDRIVSLEVQLKKTRSQQ